METRKPKILLLGSSGHCASVVDSLIFLGEYSDIGIVDLYPPKILPPFTFYAGSDADLPLLYKRGFTHAFPAAVGVRGTELMRKLFYKIKEVGFVIPSIIDCSAVIAKNTKIGEGVFVGKRAVINSGAGIGDGSVVNTSSVVEHDCQIGRFCHIAPGAVLCGGVKTGDSVYVGSGATVIQNIILGSNSLIGAGSCVICDMNEGFLCYGTPCRERGKL